ncbi:MAG: hypothetical protein Rubg2KO_40060 [Rubricoccaceae bacterium]
MRVLVLALTALLLAPALRAQDATVDVLFDRATSELEAMNSVFSLAPAAISLRPSEGGHQFPLLSVGRQLEAPPSTEVVNALFDSGAVAVQVLRPAVHLAAATGFDVERMEQRSPFPPYIVTVEYPSTVTTEDASATFVAVLGGPPTSVSKGENLLRLSVPDESVAGLTEQLQAVSGVVAVRVNR